MSESMEMTDASTAHLNQGRKASKGAASDRPEYKEEPGPVIKRSCHDVFWLLLYILYWGGMIGVAVYANSVGNPYALLYGTDSLGYTCGTNNTNGPDLTNATYLYVYALNITASSSITSLPEVYSVCLNSCPTDWLNITWADVSWSGVNLSQVICTYGYSPANFSQWEEYVLDFKCGAIVYPTKPTLQYCLPSSNISLVSDFQDKVTSLLNSHGISVDVYTNLYTSWEYILASAAVAVGVAFVWLIFLQFFAGVMVWLTLIAALLTSLGFTAYLWLCYYVLLGHTFSLDGFNLTVPTDIVDAYQYNTYAFLGFAIFMSVIAGFLLLFVLFMFRRIALATAIIEVASKVVSHTPSLFLVPVIKMLFLVLTTAFVVYILVSECKAGAGCSNLASAGKVTTFAINGIPFSFTSNNLIQYLQLYVIFGFFWAWNFTIAIGQTVLAGAVATWYWTKNKKRTRCFVILPSYGRVFRYHLGSLALGSFLIAVVQFIRYLLLKLQKSLNKSPNKILKALLCALQCCFLCVERFLKMLTKNAYVEIAVYGYSFCAAARHAMEIITRNILRVWVLDNLGALVFFMTDLLVTCTAAIVGNYLLINYSPNPSFWVLPLVVMVILGYGIASTFSDVLRMSCATIFVCFCEDSERNDGQSKPYYAPPELIKFVDRHAKDSTDLGK